MPNAHGANSANTALRVREKRRNRASAANDIVAEASAYATSHRIASSGDALLVINAAIVATALSENAPPARFSHRNQRFASGPSGWRAPPPKPTAPAPMPNRKYTK